MEQNSTPRNRKPLTRLLFKGSSPDEIADTVDSGDDTQRRYSYQHAYGVIILIASLRKAFPYIAIVCEHHEDFLGELPDGSYDAYQIKTATNEKWDLTKEPLMHSIRRFVNLNQQCPEKFNKFYFVSNVKYEDSAAIKKIARSPIKLLSAVKQVNAQSELPPPINTAFEALRNYCNCEESALMDVLCKLELLVGPDLDGFRAVIAHEHLPLIPKCRTLSPAGLALLRDDLIAQVARASSLAVDDPSRHWYPVFGENRLNPAFLSKRILVDSVEKYIQKNITRFQSVSNNLGDFNDRLDETIFLYLRKSFNDDRVAKLDQAGDPEVERSTPLGEVFVDLEIKPREGIMPKVRNFEQINFFGTDEENTSLDPSLTQEKNLSAMSCLLKEAYPNIVIIGGPGQGKSTLGQFLSQIHRESFLQSKAKINQSTLKDRKYQPKIARIPFRIILKYFAQWISDRPQIDTIETYIAEQINRGTSRVNELSGADVQEILKRYPILVIFDGLDEVTEQELRSRVLARIEDFLSMANMFDSNLQVIATSRPTGYTNQFDPGQFWHLELQPMSIPSVRSYASRWTIAKVALEEERRRVNDTLEECLQEEHTRLLLTTPLQVTIVLFIIKDGGRPPAQREALFQNYWLTILRREKSKFKNVIKTDDTQLFDLHAYLGFILHSKSLSENVNSLLSAKEFEALIYKFLQEKDKVSDDSYLRSLTNQMIKDARDRLVLLVEPIPGFFGFELRSIQEFFAGAYLVQSADSTNQRFDRLKAIARSEHWRNVALFFAGRIVRNFSGEAQNILDAVCKVIDSEPPDIYLQRGSWLALDIAADGAFASNRNLQYNALEYALRPLLSYITLQAKTHIASALGKISPEDRRDIVGRLFRQMQPLVSFSGMQELLSLYDPSIGTEQDFIRGLETLFLSNDQKNISQALRLGFKYKMDPTILSTYLEKYWHLVCMKPGISFHSIWQDDPLYFKKVISCMSLSIEEVSLALKRQTIRQIRNVPNLLITIPRTYSEQIETYFQCYFLVTTHFVNYSFGEKIEIYHKMSLRIYCTEKAHKRQLSSIRNYSDYFAAIKQIMEKQDLAPDLLIVLWILYWLIDPPNEVSVIEFLKRVKHSFSQEKFALCFKTPYWRHLRRQWPLLSLIIEKHFDKNVEELEPLLPYVTKEQHFRVSQKINSALQKLSEKLTEDNILDFDLNLRWGEIELLPILSDLAKSLNMNEIDIFNAYVSIAEKREGNEKLPQKKLKKIFSHIDSHGFYSDTSETRTVPSNFFYNKWLLDQETFELGKLLIISFLKRKNVSLSDLGCLLEVFVKLITYNEEIIDITDSLFPALALFEKEITRRDYTRFSMDLFGISRGTLLYIANLINNENETLKRGAFAFWEFYVNQYEKTYPLPRIGISIKLNWAAILPLLKSEDVIERKRGIKLLGFSNFPLHIRTRFQELLNLLAQIQSIEEINAFAFLLKAGFQDKGKQRYLKQILEEILGKPQIYAPKIISAAIERYTDLIGNADPRITAPGNKLGLPII